MYSIKTSSGACVVHINGTCTVHHNILESILMRLLSLSIAVDIISGITIEGIKGEIEGKIKNYSKNTKHLYNIYTASDCCVSLH